MATERNVIKRSLNLYVEDGVNNDGSQKIKLQTYNGLKESATDEDILAVADAIASLKSKTVQQVVVSEKVELVEGL